ncbi:hypothetical protein BpHYR1_002488, partial [Brachionus plicatilis]
ENLEGENLKGEYPCRIILGQD